MSEKILSIQEAINSGERIPPSIYEMWLDEVLQQRNTLVDTLKKVADAPEYDHIASLPIQELARITLQHVGEL